VPQPLLGREVDLVGLPALRHVAPPHVVGEAGGDVGRLVHLIDADGPNQLEGADGADELIGLGGDDLLIGGFFGFVDPEEDTADGGLGTDACDAETEIACEADPPEEPANPSMRRPSARTTVGLANGMRSK
jgi:hypothetical protein